MKFKVIYEDTDLLVINKPSGIVVFNAAPESEPPVANFAKGDPRQRREYKTQKNLIDYLLEKYPYLKKTCHSPRYGIVHRLDKDTSGILLVAKNNKTLGFLQKQFKNQKVIKKYLALVIGSLKTEQGIIETLMGRSPKDRKKQKVYLPYEPGAERKRMAITEYKALQRFKEYSLVEILPKSGRKHQIRTHLAYLGHPIAGDKMYGFKGQICPKELSRQFLHASYLKIKLPNNKEKEFKSNLPKNLKDILNKLK